MFWARLVFAKVASVFLVVGAWWVAGRHWGRAVETVARFFFLSTGRTGAKGWFEVLQQVSAFFRRNGGVDLFSFDDGGARGGWPGKRVVFCRFSCFGGFAASI